MIKQINYFKGVVLKRWIESYPPLFVELQKIRYRKSNFRNKLAEKDTDIVIEGYPRSANSFSVKAFKYAQGNKKHKIGEHTHAYAQIQRATTLGLPTIVLVRQPYEAVLSTGALQIQVFNGDYKRFNKEWDISWSIEYYIRFYEEAAKLHDKVVLGKFEEVTKDFGGIREKVNAKFGTDFIPFEHTPYHQEQIFKSGKKHLSPSKERNNYKKFIKDLLSEPKNKKLMQKAEKTYLNFLACFEKENG